MKSSSLTISVLLVLAASIQASPPDFNQIYNITFPAMTIINYANGLFYFGYSIYNATSGVITPQTIPSGCSTYASFSPSVIPWCYGFSSNQDDTSTFQVHYLNAYLNESLDIVNVAIFPRHTYVSFEETYDFIVFEFTTYGDSVYNSSLIVYNLDTKANVCPFAAIDEAHTAATVYTDGNIFIYGYLDSEKNSFFVMENCTSGINYTSPSVNELTEVDLFGFNNSAVFINSYVYQKNNQNTYYIEPASFDSFHRLRFGTKINITTFLPYNETHFFISYYPNGKFTFGLFVVNTNLQIQEVLSFDLGIVNDDFSAYPIYGTNLINLYADGLTATYDISQRAIIGVKSVIPPIVLSNGSVVNTTQWGYFIQNPGGPFYFIEAPFSNPTNAIYQDPSDFGQYYTLFIPSNTYNYYSKCVLTHFNITSSIIKQTFFPNCPLSPLGNPINIKDVQYDANGNAHVAYRDQAGSVFVINPAGSNGPIKATYLYSSVQISLNLTNGTFTFVGTQLRSYIMGHVSYTTGTVFDTYTVPTTSYYTTVAKINPQYFLLAYTETIAKFALWDCVNFKQVNFLTSSVSFTFYATNPLYLVGFNASSGNFTGIVFWTNGYIYLMNSAGETATLDPGSLITVVDVIPISNNLFFATQYQSYLYGVALYEIDDWGTISVESKKKIGEIDY